MITEYLRRLGLAREVASVDYLFALQRAHVSRVTYSNLQIMRGAPASIDPEASVREVVAGRGGYCFHLNGAFSWLLRELGFAVTLHRGYVRNAAEGPQDPALNHLALLVHDLGPVWLVDAGLGDAIHEPLPLVPGSYEQGPFRYALASSSIRDGWRFTHDATGSFATMDFEAAATTIDAFAEAHTRLSIAQDSPFRKFLTAQVRHADRVEALRGCTLTTIDGTGRRQIHLDTEAEWLSTLVRLGLAEDGLALLWPTERATHEVWLASA
jgi:arylamine N-acetyltransferase